MAERPTKKVIKKSLASEVTTDLIQGSPKNKSNNKYRKMIVWDGKMKEIIECESKKRGMSTTGFIKYCVAKELSYRMR